MQNIAIVIAYNGAGFHGFQSKPGSRSVQTSLISALETVLRTKLVSFSPSGRTDRGVSAKEQVCSFKIDSEIIFDARRVCYSVSSLLKNEVQLRTICAMPEGFHARHSKHCKQYSYLICNHVSPPANKVSWHISGALDICAMQQAAEMFEGYHDFRVFRHGDCSAKTTVRTVLISELITQNRSTISYRVVGNGFLMHMVRILVGTLVEVGLGKRTLRQVEDALRGEQRALAGVTAPPEALSMDWVRYDDLQIQDRLDVTGF